MRNTNPQPLNYASPLPRLVCIPWWRRLPPGPTGFVIVLLISVLLLASPLYLPHRHDRRPARVVQCSSHLRQIYVAIASYAQSNHGLLPTNLGAALEAADYLYPDIFTCPGSTDTPATGPTTRAVALDLARPGHSCPAMIE